MIPSSAQPGDTAADTERLASTAEPEDDILRSAVIRELLLAQSAEVTEGTVKPSRTPIPRSLVRFWHDPAGPPDDVSECMASWDRLSEEGFVLRSFDDNTASRYIGDRYGSRQQEAFRLCPHPAMRCDYFRMCILLSEGGLYVDADDVLISDGWRDLFLNDRMKLQALCYDVSASRMMPSADVWRDDLPPGERIFYVNNDPIAAPAGHPLLRRALDRATRCILHGRENLDIQASTGPGNLSAALAAHAWELRASDQMPDFQFIRGWDEIAEMRWNLSYRGDDRNWRNIYGC